MNEEIYCVWSCVSKKVCWIVKVAGINKKQIEKKASKWLFNKIGYDAYKYRFSLRRLQCFEYEMKDNKIYIK
jgi:hypothetical protein